MKKIWIIALLLTTGLKASSEEFPLTIFTAEYYYTFFTANLKYKLEKLHDQFPHRRLTTYWQYAVNDRCETLYSHAIIPQIINNTDKLTILLNITECGTPVKWFRFEYLLNQKSLSASEIDKIKQNLVKFQLPAVDWNRFKQIQIATDNNYFFWTESLLFARSTNDYSVYELRIEHSHYFLNTIKQNQLKLQYTKLKNDHQVDSKVLMVSYQPATEDHFPQISYLNELGVKITAKSFIVDYKYYFSSTLNDLILDLTNITPQSFGVSPPTDTIFSN